MFVQNMPEQTNESTNMFPHLFAPACPETHEQAIHTYRTGTPAGKETCRGCLHLGELNNLHHLQQII